MIGAPRSDRRAVAAAIRRSRHAVAATALAATPGSPPSQTDLERLLDALAAAIDGDEEAILRDHLRYLRLQASRAGAAEARLGAVPTVVANALRGHGDIDPAAAVFLAGAAAATANPAPAPGLTTAAAAYLDACLDGDRKRATELALRSLDPARPAAVYVDVLTAAQAQLGALWETGRITAAQEHVATAVSQLVLAHLYARLEPQPPRRRALVLAVEGERHQLGSQVVADLLEVAGWRVRFLGSDVPIAAAKAEVASHRPELLGLSLSVAEAVAPTAELIAAVAAGAERPHIVVGGRLVDLAPGLWRELGADAPAPPLSSLATELAPPRLGASQP